MGVITLVLVDDHHMFLDGMSAVLAERNDMKVLCSVGSAKEALEYLSVNLPDLLITDISMPEMNGLEFIKTVKKRYPALKILVVSMFQQIQSLKGIEGYLLKETGYGELIKAIRNIVLDDQVYFSMNTELVGNELEFKNSILTTREKEIVALIANELTTVDIANKLFISKNTVETHKKNIFLKLQVNSAAGLIKKAIYLGYI